MAGFQTHIAVSSALASRDRGSPALLGVLAGILVYDVTVAGLLAFAGGSLGLAGVALWPAVALHAALAVWCVACLQRMLRAEGATALKEFGRGRRARDEFNACLAAYKEKRR